MTERVDESLVRQCTSVLSPKPFESLVDAEHDLKTAVSHLEDAHQSADALVGKLNAA